MALSERVLRVLDVRLVSESRRPFKLPCLVCCPDSDLCDIWIHSDRLVLATPSAAGFIGTKKGWIPTYASATMISVCGIGGSVGDHRDMYANATACCTAYKRDDPQEYVDATRGMIWIMPVLSP